MNNRTHTEDARNKSGLTFVDIGFSYIQIQISDCLGIRHEQRTKQLLPMISRLARVRVNQQGHSQARATGTISAMYIDISRRVTSELFSAAFPS